MQAGQRKPPPFRKPVRIRRKKHIEPMFLIPIKVYRNQ